MTRATLEEFVAACVTIVCICAVTHYYGWSLSIGGGTAIGMAVLGFFSRRSMRKVSARMRRTVFIVGILVIAVLLLLVLLVQAAGRTS
jgi:FtsH-binding integral membrane protein